MDAYVAENMRLWTWGWQYPKDPETGWVFSEAYQQNVLNPIGYTWPTELGMIHWGQYIQGTHLAEIRMYLMVLAWLGCMWLGFKVYDWLGFGSSDLNVVGRSRE